MSFSFRKPQDIADYHYRSTDCRPTVVISIYLFLVIQEPISQPANPRLCLYVNIEKGIAITNNREDTEETKRDKKTKERRRDKELNDLTWPLNEDEQYLSVENKADVNQSFIRYGIFV